MDVSVVILAGGKATRLGGVCKPMIAFAGTPFLAYQVSHFVRLGCKEVIIVSGYLSEVVEGFFATDTWLEQGVRVVRDHALRGTAHGALVGMTTASCGVIFQCNGDTVVEFDFAAAYQAYIQQVKPVLALLTLLKGVQNQGAALVRNGIVVEFNEGRPSQPVGMTADGFRGSSTGCYFTQKDIALAMYAQATSFEREVLPALVDGSLLAGHNIGFGRLIDFGTRKRLAALQAQSHILVDVYGQPLM